MALKSSIFGTQFSQRQGQITQNNKKKCVGNLEGSSVALKGCHRIKTTNEGKIIHQKLSSTKNFEKEKHAGKPTLHFDWFAPHFSPSFRHKYPL